MPRDVILCAWHYDRFLEKPAGHAGGPQFDKFQSYDELGFEYWFAPGVFSLRNVMSFTDYALGGNPSGVILTSWELERSFPHAERPVVAYGGEIWQRPKNKHEQTLDMIIKKVAGCSNDGQVSAITNILNSKNITLPNNYQAYLRGPLGNEEYERKLFNEFTLYTISPRLQELDENDAAYPVLEEIIIRSEEEALYFQLREILPNWFKPGSGGAVPAEVDALNKKIADLKRKRSEQWNKHRYGIEPCETDAYFNGLLEMIENAKQKSSNVMASLKVKFNISTSTVRFLIKYQGCSDWQEVVAGAPKASVHFAGNQCVYPVFRGDIPERMRIESSGYVGTGVVYV